MGWGRILRWPKNRRGGGHRALDDQHVDMADPAAAAAAEEEDPEARANLEREVAEVIRQSEEDDFQARLAAAKQASLEGGEDGGGGGGDGGGGEGGGDDGGGDGPIRTQGWSSLAEEDFQARLAAANKAAAATWEAGSRRRGDMSRCGGGGGDGGGGGGGGDDGGGDGPTQVPLSLAEVIRRADAKLEREQDLRAAIAAEAAPEPATADTADTGDAAPDALERAGEGLRGMKMLPVVVASAVFFFVVSSPFKMATAQASRPVIMIPHVFICTGALGEAS